MEQNEATEPHSFWTRLRLGLRLIFSGEFAGRVARALKQLDQKPVQPAPERLHASALLLLSALQRDGRFVDFLQQDVSSFSDDQVGAAARVVHGGCRNVLRQYFDLSPAAAEPEGSEITVPKGFDQQQWRLTGNVAGQPPFRGTLKHHGWVARTIRMPAVAESMDPRVLAPAELELA